MQVFERYLRNLSLLCLFLEDNRINQLWHKKIMSVFETIVIRVQYTS